MNNKEYKQKVYISGPMSGRSKEDINHRFSNAAAYLKNNGYEPVSPALMSALPFEYSELMEIDLKILSYCDGIYMLKGWRDSFGANMELQYAVMKQHFVVYEDESEAVEC